MPRLGIFPNLLHFVPQTSHNPDVVRNAKNQTFMSDVLIGKGKLAGKGVFAARDFKKGEIVVQYHLIPLSQEDYEKLPESEKEFTHSYRGQIFLYQEPERYVNHSDSPNTYQDHIQKADIALRDIKKGEMITTDATKDDVE